MKFLLAEILICLSAAGLLGLLVGWLMKAGLARRTLARTNSDWDKQYLSLKHDTGREIGELNDQAILLKTDNTTLISKVESLSAMVKSGETALLGANEEIKSLTGTLASQQITIKEITAESENLVKIQSDMQSKLETLEKAKEQELAALATQAGEPPQAGSPAADKGNDSPGPVPVLDTPTTEDAAVIDDKIRALNAQRDRLNREREELFQQEQLLASQLTRGDDTEAYLDQTIRIDDDMTASIQAGTASIQGDDEETHQATGEIDPADQTMAGVTEFTAEPTHQEELDSAKARPKSLWDKLKLGVTRADEKTS